MGVEDASPTTVTAVRCGACGKSNGPEAKFCEGCGQSLYEPCPSCKKPVLLTQRFCGSCGADLARAIQDTHDKHAQVMTNAVAAAKDHDFERAITLLQPLTDLADYRFRETVESATQAIQKIGALRQQAIDSVNDVLVRAKAALENDDQAAAVQLLESVPAKLLNDDAKKILVRVKTFSDEKTALENEIREAIQQKNWPLVGGLIDQILDLAPRERQYRQLADQVSEKLIATAKRLLENGKYATAARQLDAVPRDGQTNEFHELRDRINNVHWLSTQFEDEPFVSPTLGRLAMRFAKEVPSDEEAQALVKQLAARLKKAPRKERTHLPVWKGNRSSWLGGEIAILGVPEIEGLTDSQPIRAAAGRFNVAIGLALQGLGKGRIDQHFGPKKKGLLGSLGRKKATLCWGIDVGNASFKAVCLEQSEDGIEIVSSYFEEIETPLCRPGNEEEKVDLLSPIVERFMEEHELEDEPVWVNIAASHVVSRFVRLPPLRDKEARQLLALEIEHKIPVPMDELVTVQWMQDLPEEETHGRPAVALAARNHIVEDRLNFLEEIGLSVTGLQADTIALVNFAAHEFEELWESSEDDENDEDEDEGIVAEDEIGDEEAPGDDVRTKAVALIDCGAATMNLVIVSGEGHWSWTFETGGEDLTSQLARACKVKHAEAEQLKRNPAGLDVPAKRYEPVEQRQSETRVRMETVFVDAAKQNTRFDIVQTWCMGGGCLAHRWMRNTVLSGNSG